MPGAHHRPASLWFARYLTFAGLGGVALLVYATVRFPASLAMGGLPRALVSSAALIVYVIAAWWARRRPSPRLHAASRGGAAFGIVLGAAVIVGHTLEIFAALEPPLPAILGVGMWGVMFLLLGLASARAYDRFESIALGIASSVCGAFVSASTTVAFAFILGLMFMARMERFLAAPFAASGMTDARAFVVRNMLDGATAHLLIAPVVGVLAGAASAGIGSALRSIRRPAAVALALAAACVLAAGLGALYFASSLERSARPPFVVLGLISLGAALTAAGPVLTAIRGSGKA